MTSFTFPPHSSSYNLFYYGLAYNMANLSGNEFWNFFFLGAVEFPSNLLGWWGAQTLGRRWTAAGASMLAALGALVTAFLTGKCWCPWTDSQLSEGKQTHLPSSSCFLVLLFHLCLGSERICSTTTQ